jgi:hypothetical protein
MDALIEQEGNSSYLIQPRPFDELVVTHAEPQRQIVDPRYWCSSHCVQKKQRQAQQRILVRVMQQRTFALFDLHISHKILLPEKIQLVDQKSGLRILVALVERNMTLRVSIIAFSFQDAGRSE